MKFRTRDSRNFFYLLLVLAGFTTYYMLSPYFATIVFSLVVLVMFRPVYDRLERLVRGRSGIATTLAILLVFLVVLAPLGLVINLTVSQAAEVQRDISGLVGGRSVTLDVVIQTINDVLRTIPYASQYTLTEAQVIETARGIVEPIATFLADQAVQLGTRSAEWITKLIIFIAVLAGLFPRFPAFIEMLKDLSPLDDELDQIYIDRMTAMTKSMVKGVFVIALVQGLVTGLFFWIAGVKYVVFLTLVAIVLSLIPMGGQILAVPIGLVLLMMGDIWQGVLVIAGSILVVGNIDNVLRPVLVPKESALNPALFLMSAFGGLKLFGFLGIIYGPVTMIFLVTTVEIYRDHFREPESGGAGGGEGASGRESMRA